MAGIAEPGKHRGHTCSTWTAPCTPEAPRYPGAPETLQRLRRAAAPLSPGYQHHQSLPPGLVGRMAGYGFDVAEPEIFTATLAGAAIAREAGFSKRGPVSSRRPRWRTWRASSWSAAPPAPGRRAPGRGTAGRPGRTLDVCPSSGGIRVHHVGCCRDRALSRPLLAQGRASRARRRTLCGGTRVCHRANGSRWPGSRARRFMRRRSRVWVSVPPGPPAMVGDDLWSDVEGAQRAGLQGWLVRTGKFREYVLRSSGIGPTASSAAWLRWSSNPLSSGSPAGVFHLEFCCAFRHLLPVAVLLCPLNLSAQPTSIQPRRSTPRWSTPR